MRMRGIDFWFDFASTYSYPAAMRIETEAAAAGVAVTWRPFLLGPLFQKQGWNDSPYNLNPVRGRYMWRDLERLCAGYRLPFRRPTQFPRRSILAARVGCAAAGSAAAAEGAAWLPRFARAVFTANFAQDRDIDDPEIIGAILTELGLDGAAWLSAAVTPENKERLRRATDAAWELGLFGAPSFLVNGELFWGQDRLDQAIAWAVRQP